MRIYYEPSKNKLHPHTPNDPEIDGFAWNEDRSIFRSWHTTLDAVRQAASKRFKTENIELIPYTWPRPS